MSQVMVSLRAFHSPSFRQKQVQCFLSLTERWRAALKRRLMVPFPFLLGHEHLKDTLLWFVLIFLNANFIYFCLHNSAFVIVTALFAVCSFNVTKVHTSVEMSNNWKTIDKPLNFYR